MNKQNAPHVIVVGSGPVGTIIGGHLARGGINISCVDSGERLQIIQQFGYIVNGKTQLQQPVNYLFESVDRLKDIDCDAILICTKTVALNSILSSLKTHLQKKKRPLIMSCQNGLGTEQLIKNVLPDFPVARMIINFGGCLSPNKKEVTHTWFNSPNFIAGLDHSGEKILQHICKALNESGLFTTLVPKEEILKQAYFKTILNASLSPLCTNLELTMQECLTNLAARKMVEQLIDEALQLANILDLNYGANAKKVCMEYLIKGGGHYPSMYEDIKNKRLTEIDFLNGKLLELSKAHDFAMPAHQCLTSLIVAKEISFELREFLPDYL